MASCRGTPALDLFLGQCTTTTLVKPWPAGSFVTQMRSPAKPHAGYAELDHDLPRSADPQWKKLFIALNFWDGWIDASNHNWQHYEPIEAKDWRFKVSLSASPIIHWSPSLPTIQGRLAPGRLTLTRRS